MSDDPRFLFLHHLSQALTKLPDELEAPTVEALLARTIAETDPTNSEPQDDGLQYLRWAQDSYQRIDPSSDVVEQARALIASRWPQRISRLVSMSTGQIPLTSPWRSVLNYLFCQNFSLPQVRFLEGFLARHEIVDRNTSGEILSADEHAVLFNLMKRLDLAQPELRIKKALYDFLYGLPLFRDYQFVDLGGRSIVVTRERPCSDLFKNRQAILYLAAWDELESFFNLVKPDQADSPYEHAGIRFDPDDFPEIQVLRTWTTLTDQAPQAGTSGPSSKKMAITFQSTSPFPSYEPPDRPTYPGSTRLSETSSVSRLPDPSPRDLSPRRVIPFHKPDNGGAKSMLARSVSARIFRYTRSPINRFQKF